MERVPEPELMDAAEQALAYARADFEAPHQRFVELLAEACPQIADAAWVLDLGCGPGDITRRVAQAFPRCRIHGIDGAMAMIRLGREIMLDFAVEDRVSLQCGYLPGARLPRAQYDAVISNSLLHHLAEPAVLWRTAQRHAGPGGSVFIMDLMRPASREAAAALVDAYAADEPEILRTDFYHSLLAAYTPDEVRAQLAEAGLTHLEVNTVSDRHLTVHGRLG